MNSIIHYRDLGYLDYAKALEIQQAHFKYITDVKIQNRNQNTQTPTPNFFFFVSHPHVYTLGKNGNEANILFQTEDLKTKGISCHKTNRGGDSTYHGPGQIVGYPIIDLDNFFPDIRRYMQALEEVIIRTLSEYGITGERSDGEIGVWLDVGTTKARKICAMGVHISRWVTMHGFALNINTDLHFFRGIVPCGIANKGVTSLSKELHRTVDEEAVKKHLLRHFSEVFQAEFTNYDNLENLRKNKISL